MKECYFIDLKLWIIMLPSAYKVSVKIGYDKLTFMWKVIKIPSLFHPRTGCIRSPRSRTNIPTRS